MRILPIILAAMVFATPAFAEKPTPEIEITYDADTYRYGEVYRSERGTSVEDCAMMCNRDRGCVAWSLTPATFRMGPRCELKSAPGQASHRPGAASGMAEIWQMDPARHGEMRYQPPVFGDPLPAREPELMGAPEPKTANVSAPMVTAASKRPAPLIAAAPAPVQAQVFAAPKRVAPTPTAPQPTLVVKAPAPASPTPKQQVAVLRGPGQGDTPSYVKQPAPAEPHPLYGTPARTTEQSNTKMVFRDPSLQTTSAAPQPDVQPADYNAVLKRERQAPVPVQAAATPADPIAPARAPWTDRIGAAPDYSVSGSDYIPGDEDATAGFVDGAPEAGS